MGGGTGAGPSIKRLKKTEVSVISANLAHNVCSTFNSIKDDLSASAKEVRLIPDTRVRRSSKGKYGADIGLQLSWKAFLMEVAGWFMEWELEGKITHEVTFERYNNLLHQVVFRKTPKKPAVARKKH